MSNSTVQLGINIKKYLVPFVTVEAKSKAISFLFRFEFTDKPIY